jgi:hypothetical protein
MYMKTQTLTIKVDPKTQELFFSASGCLKNPEMVRFVNKTDKGCVIWFENCATFGLRSLLLDIGKRCTVPCRGKTTKYWLFIWPAHRSGPEDIPVGS